ncbi:hypothetical protein ACR6A7_07050, partial [Pantoea sp. RRHST58]|uniref:hypothetical protein n=1 Tax=Pantoea sp. RRHST58 TaxID=3425183 RepID=UPI003DA01967
MMSSLHAIYENLSALNGKKEGKGKRGGKMRMSGIIFWPETQKTLTVRSGLSQMDAWQFPTLAWGDPTLPSALRRFTS